MLCRKRKREHQAHIAAPVIAAVMWPSCPATESMLNCLSCCLRPAMALSNVGSGTKFDQSMRTSSLIPLRGDFEAFPRSVTCVGDSSASVGSCIFMGEADVTSEVPNFRLVAVFLVCKYVFSYQAAIMLPRGPWLLFHLTTCGLAFEMRTAGDLGTDIRSIRYITYKTLLVRIMKLIMSRLELKAVAS